MSEAIYMQEALLWIPDNKFDFFIERTQILNTYAPAATPTAISIPEVVGLLTKTSSEKQTPILDGDEANIEGVIVGVCDGVLNSLDLAAGATSEGYYWVLKGGPALINLSKLVLTDVADATIDQAAVITRLAALDIKYRTEPTYTSTQAG